MEALADLAALAEEASGDENEVPFVPGTDGETSDQASQERRHCQVPPLRHLEGLNITGGTRTAVLNKEEAADLPTLSTLHAV